MISAPVYAETVPDYEHMLAGECLKKPGFFFSEDGMANLYLSVEEKIKLAVLDKQKELNLCKVDLENCTKSKEIELQIQKEMFEKQLLVKQDAIDAYKNQAFWGNILATGGVIIGIGAGFFLGKYIIK
jgi:hypothetical protein